MIVTGTVAAALVRLIVPKRVQPFAVAGTLGLAVAPPLAVAAPLGVWITRRSRAISAERRASRLARSDGLLAVELVAAGVAAGVAFDAALTTAASEIGGDVARSMMQRLRTFRRDDGGSDDDDPIATLIAIARRSEASGSRLADELRALAETGYAIDAAATAERLARLPVTMLFPLALLILPGFILVAVAPALISGITRLGL